VDDEAAEPRYGHEPVAKEQDGVIRSSSNWMAEQCSAGVGCEGAEEPPLTPRTEMMIERFISSSVERCLGSLAPSSFGAHSLPSFEVSSEAACGGEEEWVLERTPSRSLGGLSLDCGAHSSGGLQCGKRKRPTVLLGDEGVPAQGSELGQEGSDVSDSSPTSVDWHDFEGSVPSPSKRPAREEPGLQLQAALNSSKRENKFWVQQKAAWATARGVQNHKPLVLR